MFVVDRTLTIFSNWLLSKTAKASSSKYLLYILAVTLTIVLTVGFFLAGLTALVSLIFPVSYYVAGHAAGFLALFFTALLLLDTALLVRKETSKKNVASL